MSLGPNWTTRPYHRDWLMAKANALFDMFQNNAVNPKGGFFDLDAAGKPYGNLRQIHATARMVHCFALGAKLGRPGSTDIIACRCAAALISVSLASMPISSGDLITRIFRTSAVGSRISTYPPN